MKLTSKDSNNNNADTSQSKNAFEYLFQGRGIEQQACKICEENTPIFTENDILYNVVCEHCLHTNAVFPNLM